MKNVNGVYKITNLVNGKVYVGSAVQVRTRWCVHRGALERGKHHSSPLQNAWHKYGKENFEFSLIEECSREALRDREQHWMDLLGAHGPRGYNVVETARGTFGYRHTPAARAKMSAARIARGVAPETGPRISAALKGIVRAPEFGRKISKTKTGTKRPPFSDGWKANIGAASRSRWADPEFRKRMHVAKKAAWVVRRARSKLHETSIHGVG